MEIHDIDHLLAHLDSFDDAVRCSPGIDHYCSSSAWSVAAHLAFNPEAPTLIMESDAGWVAMGYHEAEAIGRYYAPLESMWGLACPMVGPDSVGLARGFFEVAWERRGEWDALWISGLGPETELFGALVALFSTRCSVRWGPRTSRYVADLSAGYDHWLSERTRKFRKNLRSANRRVAEAGIRFEAIGVGGGGGQDPHAVYARIQAIEARSWKGREEAGIGETGMREFYAEALKLLMPRQRLHGLIARRGGEDPGDPIQDVGYIFGGTFETDEETTFRGLQCSFDHDLQRLSLGNVLHDRMIAAISDRGIVAYDLGSEIPYKARWGDRGAETVTIVVLQQ